MYWNSIQFISFDNIENKYQLYSTAKFTPESSLVVIDLIQNFSQIEYSYKILVQVKVSKTTHVVPKKKNPIYYREYYTEWWKRKKLLIPFVLLTIMTAEPFFIQLICLKSDMK